MQLQYKNASLLIQQQRRRTRRDFQRRFRGRISLVSREGHIRTLSRPAPPVQMSPSCQYSPYNESAQEVTAVQTPDNGLRRESVKRKNRCGRSVDSLPHPSSRYLSPYSQKNADHQPNPAKPSVNRSCDHIRLAAIHPPEVAIRLPLIHARMKPVLSVSSPISPAMTPAGKRYGGDAILHSRLRREESSDYGGGREEGRKAVVPGVEYPWFSDEIDFGSKVAESEYKKRVRWLLG